jgi:2-polyprenyl-3-methyl-5-hydroxy-6-metoxy-1,4-benzoquinol methylase
VTRGYGRDASADEEHMTTTAASEINRVKPYWESHTLGLQYVKANDLEVGSAAFFGHIRPWMNPYKFPEIMPRIEEQAARLEGKHLLEVGCGMGFDSLEFLKRGVRVTATDLTQAAVDIASRHFALEGYTAEAVKTENALALSFGDNTFDAVWACGVVHHTGNTARAVREIHRVLKPGGRALIMHLYRRPSWMYFLSKYGRENIEFKEEDAPITHFVREREALAMFDGFQIEETHRDHYRCLPVARTGVKAALYTYGFRPVYNLLPSTVAQRLAYKFSVVAVKK